MKFVIIGAEGEPLRDLEGRLIVLKSRAEVNAFVKPGERVEPYDPKKHPRILSEPL